MRVSFCWKIALQVTLAFLAILTIVHPLFAVLATIIALILVLNEIQEHKSEKTRFRNSVFDEMLSVLEFLNQNLTVGDRIPTPVWTQRSDSEKAGLLGKADFSSINVFYKKVADANAIQSSRRVVDAQLDLMSRDSHKAIFAEAKRLFDEVSWLKTRRSEVETAFRKLETERYL